MKNSASAPYGQIHLLDRQNPNDLIRSLKSGATHSHGVKHELSQVQF